MISNSEYILLECERQWNDCQKKDGLGDWKNQSEQTKKEFYISMYDSIRSRISYEKVLMALLDNYKIRVWQEIGDDSAKCQIGDYWFYWNHIEENDCLENFSTDEIAEIIFKCLEEPESNGLSTEEVDYYYVIMDELFFMLPANVISEYI